MKRTRHKTNSRANMESIILQKQKERFLASYPPPHNLKNPFDIAAEGAILSSIRRNPTYSKNISKDRKNEFLSGWRKELAHYAEKYYNDSQSIETYIRDVLEMKARINAQFKEILSNDISCGIRIAHCQKSLSVYLKYMWCQNIATITPPACPIDRIVLTHCGIFDISWTRLDNEAVFRRTLDRIKHKAEQNVCCASVAEWELCLFNQ